MKFWLRAVISLALLGLVLWQLDLEQALRALQTVQRGFLFLTLAALAAGVFWSAWKWQILARCFVPVPRYGTLVRWYFLGSFFNHFLPTSVGGDAARAALLAQATKNLPVAVSSVFMERLTGVTALIAIAATGSLLTPVPSSLRFLLPIYLLIMGGLIFLIAWLFRKSPPAEEKPEPNPHSGKLTRHVRLFGSQLAAYRGHLGTVGWALLLSVGFHLLSITSVYLVGRTLQIDLTWTMCLLCVPLAMLASMLPVSINGLGVRESVYVVLLSRYGLSNEQAFLVGFGTYLFVLMVSLAGGLWAMFGEKRPPGEENSVVDD